jgi:hypothetical protein
MTTSSTTTNSFDTTALVAAIEGRDADALAALYADDATITMLDRDHPPAAPLVVTGRDAIHAYYRDICGRNIDHSVHGLVTDGAGLAFEQQCRYPEGTQVVCVTVASVSEGRIQHQTASQTWDD